MTVKGFFINVLIGVEKSTLSVCGINFMVWLVPGRIYFSLLVAVVVM